MKNKMTSTVRRKKVKMRRRKKKVTSTVKMEKAKKRYSSSDSNKVI